MADVFISYASEDRDRVRPLRDALDASGYTVWWDRRLEPGTSFDREIERELSQAACVVVVWSNHSVESDWVREEAADGLQRNVLVPIQIDKCQLPLGFRRTHAAQLIGWPQARRDLSEVIDQVARLIGRSGEPGAPMQRRSWGRIFGVAALGLLGVALLGLGYYHRHTPTIAQMLDDPERYFGEPVQQAIQFTRSADGTRIAFATSGEGQPVVHVLTAFSNIEAGLNSPIYDRQDVIRLSSRDNLFVRYDGRGTGLSDREVEDWSLDARVSDLEAVVDALDLKQFGLLASSSGGFAAIAYSARHPERVNRLVLGGAFTSVTEDERRVFDDFLDFMEWTWDGILPLGSDSMAQLLLAPDGDEVDYRFLGAMLRRSFDGAALAQFLRANLQIDVAEEARRIVVPTLIIQARSDPLAPMDKGRALAALIPGSRLEIYDGGHFSGTTALPATRRRALEYLNTGQ